MASPTVLVVDDNADNRALAEAALEAEGYRVLLASRGEEALTLFEAERPDCVLLDVRMPGLDGFAVCDRLRALPGGAETPVVFLTALRDVDVFDRALAAGATDFLTKPVRPTELVIRIATALRMRKLGSELRETYELMRSQRDDLLRLQLQKERLTAFVVHDLKNPVNAIDLHAQLLLRNKQVPETARESVQAIRAELRHLLRLIYNLLDISKAEDGQLLVKRAPVDVVALLTDLRDVFMVQSNSKDVDVRTATTLGEPQVSADGDLLRRVLENLVENAIRHAPEQSVVRVEASREDRSTLFVVSDEGPGVPPELTSRIFEKYVQIDATDGRPVTRSGRGLGLAFCRFAVEAHGGSIWVEQGSPGAVFKVRLPDVG